MQMTNSFYRRYCRSHAQANNYSAADIVCACHMAKLSKG